MVRVCGVFGTWQLVTLVAALRQAARDGESPEPSQDDILVLYETAGVTDEFKEILDRIARAAWPWKRIVWAYDLLTNRTDYSETEFARTIQAVRHRVGVAPEAVDEIWACWLNRPSERLLYEGFPRARIVVYEDGLISYVPVAVAWPGFFSNPPRPWRRRLRHWLMAHHPALSPRKRFRYPGGFVDPRHLARTAAAYLQLAETEPLPAALATVPRRSVDYALLRLVLDRLAAALGEDLEPAVSEAVAAARPQILMLGQALSRNGIMSREEERDLYRDVLDAVLTKGYSVLWKEHPRVSEPFFPELAAHAEARGRGGLVRRLRLPHAYPIELVALRLEIAGCVVGTSAAPFYLKRLYRIPCYTFADDLLPYMQGVDVFMNRMVSRETPPLSELGTSGSLAEAPVVGENPGAFP